MSEFYDVGDGLIVSDDGEIVESAGMNDTLGFVARKRHQAHEQEKDWHSFKATLDAVLKRQQSERRTSYGDLVVTVMSGDYKDFHPEQFAEAIAGTEFSREELIALVLAAKDFDRELLPETALPAYAAAVEIKPKRPWVLSSYARMRAPQPVARVEAAE